MLLVTLSNYVGNAYPNEQEHTMQLVVSSVQSANVTFLKGDPLVMVVQALGTVNSSGWSNGTLVPHVYITQPEDGIQDFTFVADGPEGIQTFGFVDGFEGVGKMAYFPWMRGVRIHSSTGSVEVMFASDCADTAAQPLGEDEHWPFPLGGSEYWPFPLKS